MDHPAAGSSAGGAVVVAVEAAGARPLWTRVSVRVTRPGAAPPPAVAAAGAVVAPPMSAAAAARAPPPAWTRLSARQALAVALSLLGCVAAGVAFVAMILPPAGTPKACEATDAEMASLRTASQYLLLAAAVQVLAAAMGLLVPVAVFVTALMGVLPAFRTSSVVEMLATCHGTGSAAHGAVSLR